MSTSQTFQRYEEEFQTLTKRVKDSLNSVGGSSGYKDEESEIPSAEEENDNNNINNNRSPGDLLDVCDELLQQMALEARSGVPDAALKRELLGKVRNYKTDVQYLKDENNKRSLMISARGMNASNSSQQQHRERLLQQQEMLQNQNHQLDSARRVLQETEQVALEIGEELSSNRATIESASGRVRQVTSLTGRARRVVASMNQRAVQQKMLLYGLAASVVIVFFIFMKWFR